MQQTQQFEGWTRIMKNSDNGFFVTLGKRITQRRKSLNMTQTDLGELLSVTQQQVAAYEKGEKRIPASRLPVLADALAMDLKELVLGISPSAKKRGPAPKIQKQLEEINRLPKDKQKVITQMLDMALSS